MIGVGKYNMVWPGLTQPIMRGKELVQQKELPEDPERDAKLIKLRDSMQGGRRVRLSPLERGWTGGKPGGRSIGPPDPVGAGTSNSIKKLLALLTKNAWMTVFCMELLLRFCFFGWDKLLSFSWAFEKGPWIFFRQKFGHFCSNNVKLSLLMACGKFSRRYSVEFVQPFLLPFEI